MKLAHGGRIFRSHEATAAALWRHVCTAGRHKIGGVLARIGGSRQARRKTRVRREGRLSWGVGRGGAAALLAVLAAAHPLVQLLLGRYAEGYAALVFNLDRQNYLDFLPAFLLFLLPGLSITFGSSDGDP
jgi:hypothetical protein